MTNHNINFLVANPDKIIASTHFNPIYHHPQIFLAFLPELAVLSRLMVDYFNFPFSIQLQKSDLLHLSTMEDTLLSVGFVLAE
jgi:hypothetical protein